LQLRSIAAHLAARAGTARRSHHRFLPTALALYDESKLWPTGATPREEMGITKTVRKLCVIGVLLMPLCVLAGAQQDSGSIPAGLVWLTDGWRYQPGDDIAWAAPAFDDVSWENHSPQHALAIGSFRTLAAEALTPAGLLTRLNRSLYRAGDGGFITCLCGQIWPSGRLVLANAGHLSPYRNGEEVQLESGLPLGIVSGLEYTETIIDLDWGDRIVMLTDGAVEVQSRSGELFGFERTLKISSESAEKIAAAAQHFGQEDDITVLTLTFSPAPDLVEAIHA
jgi:Stage II sporulation protein E (SpoIIE)